MPVAATVVPSGRRTFAAAGQAGTPWRPTIAVIGAGFSGTLLALHLLRRCPGARVLLIERNRHFGRGLAYATGNPGHLLNVAAARMSAFQDRPQDFVNWLQSRGEADRYGRLYDSESFVPRSIFGAYVRHHLNEEFKTGDATRLELLHGEVLDIEEADSVVITLDRHRRVLAHFAVIAVGNFPPEPPPVMDPWIYQSAWFQGDPWAPDALTELDADAPVLLIGTGLTMVDTTMSLLEQGHRGPIYALSRRGLLPRWHAPGALLPELGTQRLAPRVTALVRHVRGEINEARQQGVSWQTVIDSLRPATQGIWEALSLAERQRFLRHLRPWWEVHRHRISATLGERVEAARSRGQLAVGAGRIASYRANGRRVLVTYRPARQAETAQLVAERIINCSGPSCDFDRIRNPLVQTMLTRGQMRPDALRLGIDVTPQNALRAQDGSFSQRLYAIGPPTKGQHWEMTSVPDIRRQCELLAAHIAQVMATRRFAPLESGC